MSDADPPIAAVREAVARAIAEDLLPLGDLTSALVPEASHASARFVSRQSGTVAGSSCVMETFRQIDQEVRVDWYLEDASRVEPGSVLGEVAGPMRSLLGAERTALNFLCHLSGIATLSDRYVRAVRSANPRTRVLDTRKTTPGLRALEKAAVRAGGASNHRASLSDAVLVKDNHLIATSITKAVSTALDLWPGRFVEVECDRIEQVIEASAAGAAGVLLDNMTPEEVGRCVKELARRPGRERVLVEVSGAVSLESAPAYARAGADLISVGALTHSAPALDVGLDFVAGADLRSTEPEIG